MESQLQGKVALLTGAASETGTATARLFARHGARLALVDLDAERGAALARELGAEFIAADLTQEDQVERALDAVVRRYGRIDCLVNGAGALGAVGSIMDTSAAHWHATRSVLLDSVFFGIKHAARRMQGQGGGTILSLSSTAGTMGGLAPHAATAASHAVIGLSRSAASELSRHGIRVNVVAAGATDASPLGTPVTADEIAAALLFLAGDGAVHVTAHTLVVDAGVTVGGFASGASALRDRPMGFIGPSGQSPQVGGMS